MRRAGGELQSMKSNIDRHGRLVRALSGVLCLGVGVALVVSAWPASPALRWLLSAFLVLAGGFQLFEAKQGW